MQSYPRKFVAPKAGRIDQIIKLLKSDDLCWLGKKPIRFLFDNKLVVDESGCPLNKGFRVKQGFRFSMLLPAETLELRPAEADLLEPVFVADDNSWAVFDKPMGMPSYSHLIWQNSSLVNHVYAWLLNRHPQLAGEFLKLGRPPVADFGLLQRLDNDTSGAVIVAFTGEAFRNLEHLRDRHLIIKEYLAVVLGRCEEHFHDRTFYLHKKNKRMMEVLDQPGTDSITVKVSVAVEKAGDQTSTVRVRTAYGARHIVRVVLQHLGYPLLGDRLYQGNAADAKFIRQPEGHTLHADRLQVHADSVERKKYEARVEVPPTESFEKRTKQNML